MKEPTNFTLTAPEPCSVCVTEGVEYLYIEGLDINDIRVPKDKGSLEGLENLIPALIEYYT